MRKTSLLRVILYTLLITMALSCSDSDNDYYSIDKLPADTGGEHIGHLLGTTKSPYGYYVYTPSFYNESEDIILPLVVFLHGSGEIGNSQNASENLDKILVHGPPKLIEQGNWTPSHPMIVVSPQCHESNWSPEKVREFLLYLLKNYKVNEKRIYLTGLSLGGYGTFYYIGEYGDSSYVAAAVPICGAGPLNSAANFDLTPIWAFHGDADGTVNYHGSVDMVEAINYTNPPIDAKVTIYPGVGHDSWTRTYDGSGMGTESSEHSPFNQSIYDWMLQYERSDLNAESF